MSVRFVVAGLFTALMVTAAPALAQSPELTVEQSRLDVPHIDLGVTGGINNPGGIYGLDASYRLLDYLSVGLAGGNGAWGFRLSPLVRAYPFGASRAGLFVEGGPSFNFGGKLELKQNGEVVQAVDQLFTTVVNASLGYRFQIARHGFIALRAGYGFKLGGNNNYRVSQGPAEVNPLSAGMVALSQPGGIMAGLTAGATFL